MQYEQLTPSQSEAVFHKEGPLLVLAGPGSGKTRVITYRVAALIDSGVGPHNICAITFTNKAADEMRQRVIGLGTGSGAHISTFHSLCVRILRRYSDGSDVSPNFSVYDESDQSRCIKQAIKDCELDTANFPPARMLEAISTLKNNLVDAETFAAEAEGFFSKNLAKIYSRYQGLLSERNAVDFDDLLLKTAFLLEGSADICCELGNRFQFLLIDEYQDTNHAQYKIAKSLVSVHNNICATGDPDQSIYRWRGADIRNILAFEKDWPDAKVVKLEENFRSTPNILEAADKLISFNRRRKKKTLIPTRERRENVVLSVLEDENEEAQAIAHQVKELADRGGSLSDMAVFYRINAMSRVLEEAFIQNKVPYQVVRGVEFYNRKEIRDLVAYLKVLVNPDDEIALLRIVNTPSRGIGKTTVDRVRAHARLRNIGFFEGLRSAEHIDSLSEGAKSKVSAFVKMIEGFKEDIGGEIAPLAKRVFVESGLEKYFRENEDQSSLENVGELINAAGNYDEQAEERSLSDYLQQIALFSDVDAYDESKGCVAFMTLHCAKGLEFENVFIVGLEDGLLPHERSAADEEEMEEERRLFFVGMTRAKVGLNISCARYRTVRGQMLRTIPSPFLYELGIGFGEISGEEENGDVCEQHDANVDFAVGDRVQHDIFGLGTVQEFIDMGDNSVVVVKFNRGQTKSLMVKYAHLLKV